MKTITTHHGDALNAALTIQSLDEQGIDGSCQRYKITRVTDWAGAAYPRENWYLSFGPNGLSDLALLAVVHDRLKGRQAGPQASANGGTALAWVTWAMEAMEAVTGEQAS